MAKKVKARNNDGKRGEINSDEIRNDQSKIVKTRKIETANMVKV